LVAQFVYGNSSESSTVNTSTGSSEALSLYGEGFQGFRGLAVEPNRPVGDFA